MKQTLKDFPNLLLVVLCDYVLGTMEYFLLEQPTHIALSNGTVSVRLQNYDGANETLRNLSVVLTDVRTNQTVVRQQLVQSLDQEFATLECFHFKSAGNYYLRIASEFLNGSRHQWSGKSILLTVEWPVFHFDLRRSSEGFQTSLQLGLFTDEYLCPWNGTMMSLDIILTSGFYELETLVTKETVGMRTRKKIDLLKSQLVKFDCQLVSQEPYIAVLLKAAESNSIIASTGPVDLMRKFGYKLMVPEDTICGSSIVVSVLPPPCTISGGRIAVLKYHLGPLGKRALKLHESIVNPENNQIAFNCTLFEKGTNKYCFEFRQLNQHDSAPRAKECVLIQRSVESWSQWQVWSPCSVTCGDGIRERFRECLTSFPVLTKQECVGSQREASPCSLEECSTTRSAPTTPLHDSQSATDNLVTVTGISLCLSIILATVLITLWRRLCRTQRCSTSVRCDSAHSPGLRKNSDEENICQERRRGDSFSEGEAPCLPCEETDIPLNLRRSFHLVQREGGGGSSANESVQSSAQKIIPPIFSYRLAQQQLKEMKKVGLTEATKVYHVSQSPLADTVKAEDQEAVAASKFRIKAPFLDPSLGHPKLSPSKPCSKVGFAVPVTEPAWSPTQSLMGRSHPRHLDCKAAPLERGHPRSSQFRRSASFHEARKAKPFRKRSMSTLAPSQTPHGHSGRTRMWDNVPEEQYQPKPQSISQNTIELGLYHSTSLTTKVMSGVAQNPHKWEPPLLEKKLDLASARQPLSPVLCADTPEQERNRGRPFLNHMDTWRGESARAPFGNPHQGREVLSPTQHRKSKCQSFPSDPEYHFYDNNSFRLTESEQQTMDLPGCFGSNEDEDLSTLSSADQVI